jgi:BMFP domain-containing protein YqiC
MLIRMARDSHREGRCYDGEAMTIDELHAKMEAEFKSVRTDMKTEFKSVRTEIQAVRSELESQIRTEGETTRRHFDIVAEQFKDYTRVLEGRRP